MAENRKVYHLTYNQIFAICDALNMEAQRFGALAESSSISAEYAEQIWRDRRDQYRALVTELLTYNPQPVLPKTFIIL